MFISETLYNKLISKKFYKFICGNALYDCFEHFGENKRKVIDSEKLINIINKFKIFRYSIDNIDYEIYNLFHYEILNGGIPYLILKTPSIAQNRTLWLESIESSDISIIDSNSNWNVKLN